MIKSKISFGYIIENIRNNLDNMTEVTGKLWNQKIDYLMVATSDHVSDDPIESVCANENIDVYRGSLDDVLARYVSAADDYLLKAKQPNNQRLNIIRLTADCPLIDSELIIIEPKPIVVFSPIKIFEWVFAQPTIEFLLK